MVSALTRFLKGTRVMTTPNFFIINQSKLTVQQKLDELEEKIYEAIGGTPVEEQT